MRISNEHRRFLLIDQCAMPTLINLVMNGLIAWFINRSASAVPIWGGASVTVDLLATSFLLPFLICVIVSSVVTRKVRSGKISPLPPNHFPISRWFKRTPLMRGLFLGGAGVLFGAVPIVWTLSLGQAQPFAVMSYVTFKAVWAAMIASLVTPIVGWWALANASRQL